MNNSTSRRCFIKQTIFIGGMLSLFDYRLIAGQDDECEQKIESLFINLQKREMREKASLFKKLVAEFGDNVLQFVKDEVIVSTRERLKNAELTNRNLNAVMENLWNHTSATHQFEVVQQNSYVLQLKVTRCLYAEEMRKFDAADIGFAFYCAYDYGFCQGLNPKIEFTRTKTLMQGDDCCDHTYKIA